MPDWSASMTQTYEYYTVDPETWEDVQKLDFVTTCTINRDTEAETLGSASINVSESISECYIRAYLVTIQNGLTERRALGTFLVQTPTSTYDGKIRDVTLDAYMPLIELKENMPPIGYSILKRDELPIMDVAYRLVRENTRAPVARPECDDLLNFDFVADTSDTWMSFTKDLIANAKYDFDLDEMGRILFIPKQDTASLQPVWTYDDSNSSILYPSVTMDHDLYGIPNVVEVVYSNGTDYYHARAVNDDPNSPISTVSRGREIIHRVTDPDLVGYPTENQIYEYAVQLLRELSTVEYTITYTHGYCPVRPRDCVRFNYVRADLVDIKAKVISQSIKCEAGCPVTEKAVFTKKLWG